MSTTSIDLTPVTRLSRDLKKAAKTLNDKEARFLVDTYYLMQDDRKRFYSQERAMDESEEPVAVIGWLAEQSQTLEKQIQRALDAYTDAHPIGAWLKGIVGIGPVIAAGLLAHIDIHKAPTVGHIWRIAGLDPTVKWVSSAVAAAWVEQHGLDVHLAAREFGRNPQTLHRLATVDAKGQARPLSAANLAKAIARKPFNAELKVLCWKAGQSFMKLHNNPECFYGGLYRERKAYEIARNDCGDNRGVAAGLAGKVGKTTEAFKHYSEGRLPPGQIDARARRYAVKLFLSHLHDHWYRVEYGAAPPKPYPIAILGHAHEIKAPH